MSRPPVIHHAPRDRRLHCGHHVRKGDPIARKSGAWLCSDCQPWIRRTVADILADAARGEPGAAGSAAR
jgi:hypothetical protein